MNAAPKNTIARSGIAARWLRARHWSKWALIGPASSPRALVKISRLTRVMMNRPGPKTAALISYCFTLVLAAARADLSSYFARDAVTASLALILGTATRRPFLFVWTAVRSELDE